MNTSPWLRAVFSGFLILSAPIALADETEKTEHETLDYRVELSGLEQQPEIESSARQILVTFQRLNDPPVSRFLLARRVEQDRKRLVELLKSRGHFDGEVVGELTGESPPLEVRFQVSPHSLYRLSPPALRIEPAAARFLPPTWKTLQLNEDDPAESARIIQAGNALIQAAQEQGFPKAKMASRRVIREPEIHRITVRYHLETGPRVQLGDVVLNVNGNGSVDSAFLKRRVPWNRGVIYHPKRLEETRLAFSGTGLFSVVRPRLAEKPDQRGLWPVEVELTERKHRTWRAGGGFSTDRGMEVNGGWEHRNYHGAGERLRTEAKIGMSTLTLSGTFDIPDYAQRGQMLKFSGKLDKATEEAYENIALELGAGLVRQVFAPGGEGSLTLTYRLSQVRELSTDIENDYSALSMPLALTLDRSNDPLDATQGWRFFTEIAPNMAVTGSSVSFLRFTNKASRYYTWPDQPRLVLAGRAEIDTTLGADQEQIPVDSRLYAGGGASLRGYGQQMAGPLDATGKPLGGRSLLAFGAEARYRLTDTIGVVGFVDAGRADSGIVPGKGLDLLYGTGTGIRYQTAVGPLRLDVATPLKKRAGDVDAPWQLYMSIGQAF
ncbi:MAG: outer membrane protein assembly factor [Magnetococcales bacterium]|nr:outer membrane protein assembly factor [Magnetococcales bacterium]